MATGRETAARFWREPKTKEKGGELCEAGKKGKRENTAARGAGENREGSSVEEKTEGKKQSLRGGDLSSCKR